MKTSIALITSILSVTITILNFVLVRKDKAIEERVETDEGTSNQKLIDYRLTQVEKKLDKILGILDSYDKEIDVRVEKAIEQHVRIYHQKGD